MISNYIFFIFSFFALVQGSQKAICEFIYSSPTVFLREGPFKDFVCNNVCADIECPSPPNENCKITDVPGKCCPAYNCGCEFNGQTFEDGENIPDDNICQQCKCSNGEKLCETLECLGPPSDNCEPVEVDGLCCPDYHCNIKCGVIGERYRNGQLLPDSCEGILIEEGQCCVRGIVYQNGARIPEKDACKFSRCYSGEYFSEEGCCDNFSLGTGCRLVYFPCRCCPERECIRGCEFDGQVYEEKEYVPSSVPCEWCRCYGYNQTVCQIECSVDQASQIETWDLTGVNNKINDG